MGRFPDSVVEKAWNRSGGRCECRRKGHGHPYGRCPKTLVKKNRGREGRGKWEPHHTSRTGPDTLSNCEILCWDCHSLTL